MKVALTLSLSVDITKFSSLFRNIKSLLEEYFIEKEYGRDIQKIYIGLICVVPQFDPFFKQRKPKYSKGKKPQEDGTTDFLEYDVKLDHGVLAKADLAEVIEITSKAIIASLPTLTAICSKLDFNLDDFKKDMEAFFSNEDLMPAQDTSANETDALDLHEETAQLDPNEVSFPEHKSTAQKITELNKFISSDKFKKDGAIFYPGLSNKELKQKLTELINLVALDFIAVLENGSAGALGIGLGILALPKTLVNTFNNPTSYAQIITWYTISNQGVTNRPSER